MTKKLDQSLRALRGDSPKKSAILSGFLGATLAGKKTVKVSGRSGFVYVRINNNLNNLVQAFNTAVSPVYDLPVFVEFKFGQYRVIGRDVNRYAGSAGNDAPYLPAHGPTHSFAGRNTVAGGGDPVWVYQEQFLPLLGIPSGTDCSPNVLIGPHLYNWFGAWRFAGYTGSPSIIPYLPTGSNNAKMLLLYIEGSSGNPKFVAGSEFDHSISGSADVIPYLPTISPTVGIPLAGVRLVTGTTVIDWPDLYDARQFFGREMAPSGTTGGGGGGAIAVQDEGAFIASGTVLNFVGAGVTATASGTNVRVYVPAGSGTPGGGTPLIIEDEGAFLVTGTDLNFVGAGVTVTASGTQARVYIPASASTPPLIVQDEGAFLVSGSSMNFVGEGVTATASGTQAQVLIPITPRIIVEDEGAFLLTGTYLNFVGDGVTVTASGTKARIYIPAGSGSSGGGGIGFVAQDEGGFLVTGSVLNFVGPGVTATASGTDVRVYIPFATGSASQMGVAVQDEAAFLVTGTVLNFVGIGVTATASGTNVRVYIPDPNPVPLVVQDEGAYLITGSSMNFVGTGVTATASGTNVRVYIPDPNPVPLVVQDEGAYLVTGSSMNFVGEGVTSTASGTNIRVFVPITPRLLIYDEGVYLVTGTTLDFVGDGVTATVSGTQARVFIPITPRLLIYDEGAFSVTGSSLNFVGDGVTVTASGTQARVYIPGSSGAAGGGGLGFVAQDEGAYLATGTTLNFVGVGVTATASGTNVRVYIPGVSGSGNSLGEPASPYLGTVPALSSFTWDNSGTCVAVEPATGGIRMSHAPNATNECYVLYKTLANSSHYRITINFIPTGWDNYNRMGIALRESSSGKILGCNLMYHNAIPWVAAHRWNSATSWFNNYNEMQLPEAPHWLQIEDDGTNLIWRFSFDGTYFIDYYSALRGDFLTANQCGLLLENENGDTGKTITMWVRSWLEQAI